MTIDEFLQPEDPAKPCPITLMDSAWMAKLQRLIYTANQAEDDLEHVRSMLDKTALTNEGLRAKLKMANEALVAKVLAHGSPPPPTKKRTPAKKRVTKPGTQAAKGVVESG